MSGLMDMPSFVIASGAKQSPPQLLTMEGWPRRVAVRRAANSASLPARSRSKNGVASLAYAGNPVITGIGERHSGRPRAQGVLDRPLSRAMTLCAWKGRGHAFYPCDSRADRLNVEMTYGDLRPAPANGGRVFVFAGGAGAMSYALAAVRMPRRIVADETGIAFHCY